MKVLVEVWGTCYISSSTLLLIQQVDMLTPSGTINLVPFYVIPIDQSECDFGSGSGAPCKNLVPRCPWLL